ncbi:hypothetical protein IT396_03500 [Candidatus Nomurabacteria bacterium]|nr:hypothetical protein [Candidatus Nomurabacteria bacterium]
MKDIGIKIIQVGLFLFLSWAAWAFTEEFIKADALTELLLGGLELAIIFAFVSYLTGRFLKPNDVSPAQSQNVRWGKVGDTVLIGILLVASPFILFFGSALLSDFLNKY